jgi:hypothetical protein
LKAGSIDVHAVLILGFVLGLKHGLEKPLVERIAGGPLDPRLRS